MSIKQFKALQIAGSSLPWVALVVVLGWAHAPKAETPSVPPRAVKVLNFTGFAEFRLTREDQPLGRDTRTGKEGLFGGWVTIPIGNRFGIRLALDGGIDAISHDAGTSPLSLLNTGGDFFLRNPNKGYVQLGYRWNGSWWESDLESQTQDLAASEHRLRYEMGLFLGDYDVEFGVEYLHFTGESTVTPLPTGDFESPSYLPKNGYRLRGESNWYATNSLSLSFEVEWGRRKVESSSDDFPKARFDRFQARLGAYWQIPFKSLVAGATVGLSVGLGYEKKPVIESTMILPPGSDVRQMENTLNNFYLFSYGFRLGMTVYFPGTSSLKERARQHQ